MDISSNLFMATLGIGVFTYFILWHLFVLNDFRIRGMFSKRRTLLLVAIWCIAVIWVEIELNGFRNWYISIKELICQPGA